MKAPLLAAAVGAFTPFVFAHPQPKIEPTSSSCGVTGYDKGRPTAYSYLKGSADDWEAACVASCLSDSKCNSFAIGNGECLLYSSSLYVALCRIPTR